MNITQEQIAQWIKDYTDAYGDDVHKREWDGKYIPSHAPYNNADDCYHKWLDWVACNEVRISALPTFEDIMSELYKNRIKGIGPLTIYDTATMLAFPKGKFPQQVHLQAGAERGARALDVVGSTVPKQVFVDICPDFAGLSTAQIEDFLCIYSVYLMQDTVGIARFEEKLSKVCGSNPGHRGCACKK